MYDVATWSSSTTKMNAIILSGDPLDHHDRIPDILSQSITYILNINRPRVELRSHLAAALHAVPPGVAHQSQDNIRVALHHLDQQPSPKRHHQELIQYLRYHIREHRAFVGHAAFTIEDTYTLLATACQCYIEQLPPVPSTRATRHRAQEESASSSSTSSSNIEQRGPQLHIGMVCIKDKSEEDPQTFTSRSTQSSSRPEIINNITREELTSHSECDIKNENQEEIELTLSGHHHVPRHQIVYNIVGQPHLECLETTASEEWDHQEECSEEKWHRESPHHECWDQEQHHEWHQDNQQEEEQQGWHHRRVHHRECHPDVAWSHQEESSYEEEWFPSWYLHQGDQRLKSSRRSSRPNGSSTTGHHPEAYISSLETDLYGHHSRLHQHHGKGEGQHQRLQHQEPAVQVLHQQHRHHRDQDSHQEWETGVYLHPVQGDHQDRHQGRVFHQDSREHQGQDPHLHYHQMNGSHRRHSGQHRLGWLPLLCLQGIFQLLPEALGHPSLLLHQDPLGSSPYLLRDQPQLIHNFCHQTYHISAT